MYRTLSPSIPAEGIDLHHIRLDVNHRRAIDGIKPPDLENSFVNPDEVDYGEGDWVWPIRRPGGKDPMLHRFMRGRDPECRPVRTVEPAEHEEVFLISYPEQSRAVRRVDENLADRPGQSTLTGGISPILVRRPDMPDRVEFNAQGDTTSFTLCSFGTCSLICFSQVPKKRRRECLNDIRWFPPCTSL
jgi:hypothetical protein